MSHSIEFSPRLRALGFRVTAQRLAILHVLLDSRSHLSPAQDYQRARRNAGGLTPPKVHRTLEFLARNGFAQPALHSRNQVVYQIPLHAHDQLVCRDCGASIEIEHGSVRRSGYQLSDSHLTLFGLRPACQGMGT
jgi:Fe2+ or Zn2+ uptake regulation protein